MCVCVCVVCAFVVFFFFFLLLFSSRFFFFFFSFFLLSLKFKVQRLTQTLRQNVARVFKAGPAVTQIVNACVTTLDTHSAEKHWGLCSTCKKIKEKTKQSCMPAMRGTKRRRNTPPPPPHTHTHTRLKRTLV